MSRNSMTKRKARQQKARANRPQPAPKKAKPANGKALHVNDSTFQREVVESELPVLVDFWAPWCGPCKVIGPYVEELAERMEGKLKVVKYDTQANQGVASKLNIRSIPALVMFKDGEVADARIGAMPPDRLEKWVKKYTEPKRGLLSKIFGSGEAEAAQA